MSAVGATGGRLSARRTTAAASIERRGESVLLRALAFAALAGIGAGEWGVLVTNPPVGRLAAVVVLASVGGLALAGSARVTGARVARLAVRVAIVIALAACALVAAGVPVRLLLPNGLDAFGSGLHRGLTGASFTSWPYDGGDHWVRLALVLGVPALVVPAAALASWPARRLAPVFRAVALGLLLVLYALPATEVQSGSPVGRGAILLALVAAWLWLPRLRGRELIPAAAILAAAAAVAVPVTTALHRHAAWIDYSNWRIAGGTADGRSFDWDQRYGPLPWSREGLTMLTVHAPRSHYWKAETLDRFDGLRWIHSNSGYNSDPSAELPATRNPRWDERIRFTVRGLQSDVLVGAGTVYGVETDKLLAGSADGTIRVIDGPLSSGDTYTVRAYVPDPSAARMRAASPDFPTQFLSYTYVTLPGPRDSALTAGPPRPGDPAFNARTVSAPSPGVSPGADRAVRERILASPYASTYRLARSLAAGRRTQYDVVESVQRYLQHGFTYDEHPPLRRYPLPTFLFHDRIGYCQQFSGAMALLLRLDGIPARVAAGFAPGMRDPKTKDYRVRDLDAHAWVEVWFSGIGWVPFDPTPSLAPASAQASGPNLPSAALGGHDTGASGARPRGSGRGVTTAAPSSGSGTWWHVALAQVAALGLALAALWAASELRVRRLRRAAVGDPELLELQRALERLGYPVAPGATLLGLERSLSTTDGQAATVYVRALRDRRFGPSARAVAQPLDRRGLRRALTAGRGPIVRLRALLALPPAWPVLRFPHASFKSG